MMSWLTQAFFSADRLEEFVDLEKEFEEGLVNSAIFLISMAMQLTNFAVNYHVSGTLSIPSPHHTTPALGQAVCTGPSCMCRASRSWSAS